MDIGRKLNQLEQRLARVERAPRLTHASIENTALQVYDGTGSLRGILGQQADGTTAINITNGPPPPQPSTPICASVLGGVTASWDGSFADGSTIPLDWARIEVHASATDGFTPVPSTLATTIETPQGATVVVPTSTPIYVRLVARNTSGTASTHSAQAGPYGPSPVVAADLLDGIVTTVKLADDAVTAAKVATAAIDADALQAAAVTAAKIAADAVTATAIATGAVGTTEISDSAITTPKLTANAVTANEIAAAAVTAAKIAAGAVIAGKLDAASVIAGNIAAAAVQAGNLAASSVQAGNIAADAVTAGTIAADAVTAREIAALAVTAAEIAANAITSGKIQAGAVDATALAADAITGKTITGGTITGALLQTASSGQRITLNESGANKILIYNSSGTVIGELSATGLIVKGTNGSVLSMDPNNTYPNFRLTNAAQTNSAVINVVEPATGDADLGMNSGTFTGSGYTDMKWRTFFGNDFWVAERVRNSSLSTYIGGRLFCLNDRARIGYEDSTNPSSGNNFIVYSGLAQLTNGRLEVYAPASSSSTLYVQADSGHTGSLLRLNMGGADKFTVDKDGNITAAGSLAVSGVGNRQIKRRTADSTPRTNATLSNDSQLTFTVDANSVYIVDGFLKYSGPGDFQMGWSFPTGTAGEWSGFGNGITVVSGTASNGTQQDAVSTWGYAIRTESTDISAPRTYGGIAANVFAVQVRATVRVGSTGGTFALQWAEGSANITGTILYTDSHLRLEKVG